MIWRDKTRAQIGIFQEMVIKELKSLVNLLRCLMSAMFILDQYQRESLTVLHLTFGNCEIKL